MKNRQWRLARFPEGRPQAADWVLSEADMPQAGPGRLLVRALYLDVAPYMRGRISPRQNYAAGVALGDVMVGGGIGEVLQSNADNLKPGDVVVTDFAFGWQEFAAIPATAVRRIRPDIAPLPYWLDAFGLNGLTAYFALFETGNMKAGETVAISAAAGSVGQIAGQLAHLAGCRPTSLSRPTLVSGFCARSSSGAPRSGAFCFWITRSITRRRASALFSGTKKACYARSLTLRTASKRCRRHSCGCLPARTWASNWSVSVLQIEREG